ncbi:MAG: glycerol-3-phosphate acyltransferase [Candidatus Caccovivens sp.]
MIYLYLFLAFLVGYLIGNINFARIFSQSLAKKDITEIGSKNPGTMNMLRTQGFGRAVLTLVFEAIKSGGPAIAGYFLFEHFYGIGSFAYFIIAFGAIVGHCFPVFYKFKGGKGVACTFGMFLFHPQFWWLSLAMVPVCFLLFLVIDYPFIISFTFCFTLSIYATCHLALTNALWYIPIIVVIWLNMLLLLFMHRGNIKRLLNGTENKVHFIDKLKKKSKTTENVEETSTEAEKIDDETNAS